MGREAHATAGQEASATFPNRTFSYGQRTSSTIAWICGLASLYGETWAFLKAIPFVGSSYLLPRGFRLEMQQETWFREASSMRTHSSWTLLLVSALAIPTPFGFGQAAAAQQSPASSAPEQSSAVLHVTANLVLVDVVVTEKGNAVMALTGASFTSSRMAASRRSSTSMSTGLPQFRRRCLLCQCCRPTPTTTSPHIRRPAW